MSASQGPEANEGGKRRAQARAVAEECLRRRAAGQSLTDDEILAAHPDIAAELAEELAKARMIGKARRAADEAPTVSEASGRPMIGTAGQAGRGTSALPDGAASDAEEESLPPSSFKVPGYSIIREISRGGQAVVFEALQESTGRKVAIKVLREGPFLTARQRARFDREVQILAALNHPNIVSIIDRGATEHGAQYLVMDYIEGRTLDQYLAEFRDKHGDAPPDPSQMLRLFLKIADAVNAAHLRGIVHRDLKPSNIRVDSRGEPHILDFGLASVSAVRSPTDESVPQPVTLTGQFLGSLPWASPEQAEGLPDKIDIRSDVYSLGVVLYQMLTGGHFPYEVAGTMRDVLNNIIMVAPTPPSQVIEARLARKMQGRRGRFRRRKPVNEVIEAIVLKSLAKGPEQRYQSAGDFARDIGNYLSGQPTIAAGMAAMRRQRRSRLVRAAAVAGGIVAACGLTAAVMLTVVVPRYFAPAPTGAPTPPAAPAAPAPPPGAPETLVRPGQWVDVLALVDPPRDTVSGEWQRQGATVSVSLPTAKWGCVVIPVAPGGDYELEVRFARLSGQDEVGVSLPVGDAAVNLCLSENGGVTGGLGLINGKNICDNETAVNPSRLENGREYVVRAQVASDGPNATIEVALDGKPYTAWRGPRAALSREEEKRLPRHNCLGLRAVGSTVAFLSARLRMLSGAAMLLGTAPAAETSAAAPAGVGGVDDAFLKEVAALPAEEQVKRVVAKLKELNPGYDGAEKHEIEDGAATALTFSTVAVADISPVRALARLKNLKCMGETSGSGQELRKGLLVDLSPLRGMTELAVLNCSCNKITDLSPLAGLPLQSFTSYHNYISDLGPLAGMPLRHLSLSSNNIADLSPLKGMALTQLMCREPRVKDLSPIIGMPISNLSLDATSITDLSPIRDLPLDIIYLANAPAGSMELLRSIKTLKTINNLPAAEFWKQVDAGKAPPAAPAAGPAK